MRFLRHSRGSGWHVPFLSLGVAASSITIHTSSLPKRDSRAPFLPAPLHASPFTFPSLKYRRTAETLLSHSRKKIEKYFKNRLPTQGGGELKGNFAGSMPFRTQAHIKPLSNTIRINYHL
jgi:hypothetical protein